MEILEIKIQFEKGGPNCKIYEYSFNVLKIVDLSPGIPSRIRKLDFQS